MDIEAQEEIRQLVNYARAQNRRSVAARKCGFRFPLAEYQRSKAMQEARIIKGLEALNPGAELKVTLSRIADLVCDIDEQKNRLPAEYTPRFTGLVDAAHGYIKSIATVHGVVIYADQGDLTDEKQTH